MSYPAYAWRLTVGAATDDTKSFWVDQTSRLIRIRDPRILALDAEVLALFRPGRGYTFPCDATGRVDLGALGERERSGYLRARALVGRELTVPALVRRALQ